MKILCYSMYFHYSFSLSYPVSCIYICRSCLRNFQDSPYWRSWRFLWQFLCMYIQLIDPNLQVVRLFSHIIIINKTYKSFISYQFIPVWQQVFFLLASVAAVLFSFSIFTFFFLCSCTLCSLIYRIFQSDGLLGDFLRIKIWCPPVNQ